MKVEIRSGRRVSRVRYSLPSGCFCYEDGIVFPGPVPKRLRMVLHDWGWRPCFDSWVTWTNQQADNYAWLVLFG